MDIDMRTKDDGEDKSAVTPNGNGREYDRDRPRDGRDRDYDRERRDRDRDRERERREPGMPQYFFLLLFLTFSQGAARSRRSDHWEPERRTEVAVIVIFIPLPQTNFYGTSASQTLPLTFSIEETFGFASSPTSFSFAFALSF